jgi:hypothetical protein
VQEVVNSRNSATALGSCQQVFRIRSVLDRIRIRPPKDRTDWTTTGITADNYRSFENNWGLSHFRNLRYVDRN